MDILYTPEIFSNQKYGGISRYYTDLMSEMIRKKNTVILPHIFHNNIHLKEYQVQNDKKISGKYINTKTKMLIANHLLNNLLIYKANRELNNRATKYIYHSTYYNSFLENKYSCKVVTVYDMINEKYGKKYKFPNNNKLIEKKYKAMKNADHIIAISNTTKKDILRYYDIKEEKISVVYLNASKINIKEKKNIILYVGNRNYYKNFNILFDAFIHSKSLNENNTLVCFGGEKISKYEKHLVINNNLSGSIQFITGGSEKLKELYAMSKVFVFSSLYEGFGIPLLESIHSGCLPLCFNIDVFNEIGKDSLIYFHNKEDLIEKLEYILSMNETDYYENLIKLRNTTNSFTLENMVLNTEKVYQSLL
jgi:glycosyltransferase involved in cell wall biosynthesis